MKFCPKCKSNKEDSEFNKSSRTKTGLRSACRDCEHKAGIVYGNKRREIESKKEPQYYTDWHCGCGCDGKMEIN